MNDSDALQTNSLPQGIKLNPLQKELKPAGVDFKYVSLVLNRDERYADLTVHGPEADLPATPDAVHKLGDSFWPLQAYRELDDALLHLRVNEPEIGLVCLRTKGSAEHLLALDQTLSANKDHWLVREIIFTWRACCDVSI